MSMLRKVILPQGGGGGKVLVKVGNFYGEVIGAIELQIFGANGQPVEGQVEVQLHGFHGTRA